MTKTSENLIHIMLAQFDPHMLTSPDGKRIEVSLTAVQQLLESYHPMLLPERKPEGI